MRDQARIVIVGGGIMGCSLAYHLGKEGVADVLLVEKGELTSGSTWHAAGQIPHPLPHHGAACLARYATDLYQRLEAETGQSVTWHGCGALRIAYDEEGLDWLRHTRSIGLAAGNPMEVVGPKRVLELHPFYNVDGVAGALHTPAEGHVDPAGATLALAHGARRSGIEIVRRNRVTGLAQKPGGEWRVRTEQGDVDCEIVVDAGGTYARQIGQWAGLDLPVVNILHQYIVTEPVPEFGGLERELPLVRDDRMVSGYIRMEQQSGLIGIEEGSGIETVWDDGTPWEAESHLFDPDYRRIAPWLEKAMERIPVLSTVGIRRAVHGAVPATPDGHLLLGPSAVPNFWVCLGALAGIGWGAGAGKFMAQWIAHGAADLSMAPFDPRRFGARIDAAYRREKCLENYSLRHEAPYPGRDRPACRPSHSKLSPIHGELERGGAVFEDVFGWERPRWYATGGTERRHIHSFRRSALHGIVGREVAGLRDAAGIADLTALAKLEIRGEDAAGFLSRVSSNRLPRRDGSVRLTYLVNPNGRLEGEATLARLGEDLHYMVYAAARERSLLGWLAGQVKAGEDVRLGNVSESRGTLMVAGPKARDILAQITDVPLDDASFPRLSARAVEVAGVGDVRMLRLSHVDDTEWELHVPTGGMAAVHGRLLEAGTPLGMVRVGSLALNSMRMERGHKSLAEVTNEVTLAEAGLERFAREGGFQGAEPSLRAPENWKIALVRLDEPADGDIAADPHGSESVWKDGQMVGAVASGAFGYDVRAWLGWVCVRPDCATPGTVLEIMVLDRMRKGAVVERMPASIRNAQHGRDTRPGPLVRRKKGPLRPR